MEYHLSISVLATFISTVLTLFAWQIMIDDKQESKIEPISPKSNEDNNTTPEKNSTSGRKPMKDWKQKIFPIVAIVFGLAGFILSLIALLK